jgi:PhzF family phenazine biosynthesis protein
MPAPFYQVDAFAARRFAGNPAAVLVLESYPADAVMQAVAMENNLAETAFLVKDGGDYRLRWFTPKLEVPLCGHATLASAAVVLERLEPQRAQVVFHTKSGMLTVRRAEQGYVMDLPARPSERCDEPQGLSGALGAEVKETWVNVFNYMAVLEDAAQVRALAPDFAAVQRIDRLGIIVTAPGDQGYDCVSRYFAPQKGIPEDPVTGAAHCMLAPYWGKRLHKTELRAFQASPRGGELRCRLTGERVELEGDCVFYLEGTAEF